MLITDFTQFPELSTKRLMLRKIMPADASAMHKLRSDDTVMQFLDRPKIKSDEEALELINKMETTLQAGEGVTWAICLAGEEPMIGSIALWRIMREHYRAEIGYMLLPEYHRKGIMQEAFEAVMDYGFNVLQLHSVEANINPANTASRSILEKNNFIQEAYFRENYYYDGKFLDSAIFSILNKNDIRK